MKTPEKKCPFCNIDPEQIIVEHPLAVAKHDGYPLTKGHTLIIPRRHVASFFDCTAEERQAMLELLDDAKAILDKAHAPDGYNIGLNNGAAAGQTVMHVHMHLIPRYAGDKSDPRGGVRWIFPERAQYWTKK
ncbi:MAG: HIT family protein [Burkholderiales bacterium]|nr:HIT family protein [Burkholderiales bacterium]